MISPRSFALTIALTAILAIALDSGAVAPASASGTDVRVLASAPDRVLLAVELGELDLAAVQADGRACVLPTLDGEAMLMDRGAPQLPVIRRAVIVEDRANVAVRVIDAEYAVRPTEALVVPSKGHLTRDQNPGEVGYEFGETYRRDSYYPAQRVLVHEPFILRDVRGVVVEIHPVRYNPGLGQIEVATRLLVEVTSVPGAPRNPYPSRTGPIEIDPEFEPIYANTFENWESLRDRYEMIEEPGRCLILTADQFYDQVLPLHQWNLQKGIPSVLTRLSEVGATANDVKNYIQDMYDEPEGLTYIVLVGDSGQLPYLRGTAENAPSDPMYVKLAGNDHYPDALISRISAQTATQVETQVARSIRYEKTPDQGTAGDWYHQACGVASSDFGGGAYDWQRANWLRDTLLGYHYTLVDQIYAPGATKQMITDAINGGRSLVNYIGHGGTTYWVTTGFSVQDVYNLSNGFKNPYICDVACVNGDFTYGECFAEAWMRAGTAVAPKGAIGIYAASTNASWVPPCDMQTEVVRLLTEEERNTLGGLSFNGVARAMDLWPGYEGTKLMEQYHLFGDCTIMMRTTNPGPLVIDAPDALVAGQTSYSFMVEGVAGARGAIYADGTLYGSAYTDASGAATIVLNPAPPVGAQLLFTVSAYNKITSVQTIPVVPGVEASIEIADWVVDGDEGAVVGKAAAVSISLRNAGPDTVHDVLAVMSAVGASSSIQDSMSTYGEVAPGDPVWGADSYQFTPDPNLPDSAVVDLALEIRSSDYLTWNDTLSVQVIAPELVYKDAIIDDPSGNMNGRLDSGERSYITVSVRNEGSAPADQLTATLISMDPRVMVLTSGTELATLAPGDTRYLDSAFEVDIQSAFPSEGTVGFTLRLNSGSGRSEIATFELPVGGFFENAEHGAPLFTHAAGEGFVDEWSVSSNGNCTPGGTSSLTCSMPDSGYSALNDARLMTPILTVAGQGHLSFWHRMEAEVDTLNQTEAYDGGILEISWAGGPFEALTPELGYNCIIKDRGLGGPFEDGIPCYGGSFDWCRVDVDLSSYVGAIQIRFRFGSDGAGNGAGWCIDDIEVRGIDATVDAPEGGLVSGRMNALVAQPNPFDDRTLIGYTLSAEADARVGIVDASGRLVRRLPNGAEHTGSGSVTWDGRDDGGRDLPSGVYLVVVEANGRRMTEQIILIR